MLTTAATTFEPDSQLSRRERHQLWAYRLQYCTNVFPLLTTMLPVFLMIVGGLGAWVTHLMGLPAPATWAFGSTALAAAAVFMVVFCFVWIPADQALRPSLYVKAAPPEENQASPAWAGAPSRLVKAWAHSRAQVRLARKDESRIRIEEAVRAKNEAAVQLFDWAAAAWLGRARNLRAAVSATDWPDSSSSDKELLDKVHRAPVDIHELLDELRTARSYLQTIFPDTRMRAAVDEELVQLEQVIARMEQLSQRSAAAFRNQFHPESSAQ